MRLIVLALAFTALAGCSAADYYGQAIGGHLSLLGRTRAIEEVLADPASAPELKQHLERVVAIREFATRALGLPDNDSYRRYADLERPYAVWNVFAAPALSLKSKEWCFVFAGCVPYRGYFARDDAERAAEQLRAEGYDVYVAGIAAYSTLGWFADPLLNTMLGRPEPELAGLLFHELAHQKIYVANDSAFNESFATAVEREGVRRWLATHHAEREYAAYLERNRRQELFMALVLDYRARLDTLYRSTENDDAKRTGKHALLDEMKQEYGRLKQRWGGYNGYDRWIQQINNARFVSVGVYLDYLPAFEALLAQKHGDFDAFYDAVAKLAELPATERHAALATFANATLNDSQYLRARESRVPISRLEANGGST